MLGRGHHQVDLQLGIFGLVVSVGYKIALVLIRAWREAERERTKVIGDQFAAIVASVDSRAQADIASHGALTDRVSRLEGELD